MEVAADAGEAIGYRSAIFEFDGAGGNQALIAVVDAAD
jgi:hypothetical protein